MRVLLLVPNLTMGGAERAMLGYAAAFQRAGHEARLLLLERRVEIAVPPGVSIEVLASGRLKGSWLNKHLYAWRLRRWLRSADHRFDLAISTLHFMDEIATLAAVPALWLRVANTLSAEVAGFANSPLKARRRAARYRAIYGSACSIAVSDGVKDDLVQNFGADPARVIRLYNPFDFALINKLAHEAEVDLPAEPFVLHVGRFVSWKRHDLLLDAYRSSGIPHRLVLLTDVHPKLHGMIAQRGLSDRVTVVGFKKNPYPWIRQAAALILSSDREGLPNILVEAMVCGTPVVSTDCPSGPREILVGPLSRWLSPCGDIEALARNLREIIASPPSVGPQTVADFDAARFVPATHALIDRLAL